MKNMLMMKLRELIRSQHWKLSSRNRHALQVYGFPLWKTGE